MMDRRGAGHDVGRPSAEVRVRIANLRQAVATALAALVSDAVDSASAEEIAAVLEDLRRRARRWRLTDARVRAAAPALVAALDIAGARARDPRAWLDTDAWELIVLADWSDVAVTSEMLDDVARRIAAVLDVEVTAVRVATAGSLPANLLERVWTEGTVLSRQA